MPVTKLQLEKRKRHLGSSDMAAILGLSKYATPYDIWCSKTGRLPEEGPINPSAMAGTVFENSILDHYSTLEHGPLIKNQPRSIKNSGVPLAANIDAIVVATGEPIEVKTVNFFGYSQELWGEANSDEIPDRVLVQAMVHMIVTEQGVCFVDAFIGGRGFIPYVVRFDETVADMIKQAAVDFWQKYVVTDTPPEGSMPSAKIVGRMRRQPNTTVQIDAELVKKWDEMKRAAKDAKADEEEAKIRLLTALGDAECGECDLGTVTYLSQTRKEHLVAESTFRTIRFKAKKEDSK